jgi:LysR family glycine cleavage system transcriptional activator
VRKWGARQGLLPNLNYLIALEASARLGSFRAAADEMHLTQGAVAQQVRALEAQMATPLFERQARGLKTTPAGSEYVDRIRLAFGIIEEATWDLIHAEPSAMYRLTLSTTPSFASRWLIPRLPRLADIHPDIALMIDASNALRPLQGPGRVDLAIRWARPPFPGTASRLLMHGRLVPVCSPAVFANNHFDDAEELATAPLISDGYSSWGLWFESFGQARTAAAGGPTFSQTSLAIDAAEQGLGVALVPKLLIEDALCKGSLVLAAPAVCQLDVGAGFYLLTGHTAPPQSPIARVIDWLIAETQGQTEAHDSITEPASVLATSRLPS